MQHRIEQSTTDNWLRNPSAEQAGPRVRPWVEAVLARYGRSSPGYLIMALYDVPRHSDFLLHEVAQWLLYDLFVAFAWGHVQLNLSWGTAGLAVLAIATAGGFIWLVRSQHSPARVVWPVLFLFVLVIGVIWASTIIWPLPYTWSKVTLSGGRYLYPAIVPVTLWIVGGWWALWPRGWRRYALGALIVGLLLMNVASVVTIRSFYQMVAAQ
ncbi:MAG: hypothetical protein ACRDIB_19320 [Ardenticatenaceae bacterium]